MLASLGVRRLRMFIEGEVLSEFAGVSFPLFAKFFVRISRRSGEGR